MKQSQFLKLRQDSLLSRFPVPAYLARPAVGIDLSDHAIKFAEILPDQRGFKLGRYGFKEIPSGVLEESKILQPEVLHKIISDLRQEFGFTYAFTSLPEEKAYAFHLSLPALKRSEIRGSIELQLEEHVPLPAEEAIFDYEIISTPSPGHDTFEVGVAVLPAELVVGYTSLFRDAGVETLALEIEGHSLARAFISPRDQGTYLIADIGKSRMVLSIVMRGIVLYTAAAFGVGGDAMTGRIEQATGLTYAEAEKIKIKKGLTRSETDREIFDALLPTVSIFRDEMTKLLGYWSNYRGDEKTGQIDQIILCGGQATLPGLADYLSASFPVPVSVADPWRNIYDLATQVPAINLNEALRFSTAIGLALRNYSELFIAKL